MLGIIKMAAIFDRYPLPMTLQNILKNLAQTQILVQIIDIYF